MIGNSIVCRKAQYDVRFGDVILSHINGWILLLRLSDLLWAKLEKYEMGEGTQ